MRVHGTDPTDRGERQHRPGPRTGWNDPFAAGTGEEAGGPGTGWSAGTGAGAAGTAQRPGRHRSGRRLSTPLILATVVGALLFTFGATAALLPAELTGADTAGSAPRIAGPGAGAGDAERLFDPTTATPGGTPTTEPTPTTRPSRTATPTVSPKPKASPTRSPSKRPSPTQSRSTSSGSGDSRESQVVTLVNRERSANGCGPVKVNSKLAAASRAHSADQAAHNKMSHTGSDGSSPWDRARRAGYQNAIGENVAAGYRSAEAVMQGWMNSPGHRANILNCQAKAIGVGVSAAANGTLYWTQMFGSVV